MKRALITLLWGYAAWTTGAALVYFVGATTLVEPIAAVAGLAGAVALLYGRRGSIAALRTQPAA